MARTLRVITEIAEDVVRATTAVAALSKGKNGAAVASLVTALEREIRRAATVRIRRRKKAAQQPRGNSGRFR